MRELYEKYGIYIIASILTMALILIILYFSYNLYEGLISKPVGADKKNKTDEVFNNKELFTRNIPLKTIRYKLPWMDAVTNSDMRSLLRDDNFNRNTIYNRL